MKLNVQYEPEIDLGKRDVVCPPSEVQIAPSCPVVVESGCPKFAERNESQSGQRFLNGSAPRLKRHVTCCEPVAGDVLSPTAGKDQKPFREFEGRALISADGAVPLAYFIYKRLIVTDGPPPPTERESELAQRALEHLDELVDTHDKRGRKKGCGAWTVRGTSFDGRAQKFIRLNCKCWDCKYCGPRRAKRSKRSIAAWAEKLQLNRFVTLTLDPKKLNGEDSTKYLNRTFAKLRSILHRKYGKALSYIRVLEYQANGNAHLHLLLNRFIEIEWLRAEWQAVGGGWMVGITRIREMRKIAGYVSKYLTKDLLMSAPKGSRRVTTSRDIRLFEKPKKDAVWELLKTSIENVRRTFVAVFNEAFCETDKSLTTFTVFANVV